MNEEKRQCYATLYCNDGYSEKIQVSVDNKTGNILGSPSDEALRHLKRERISQNKKSTAEKSDLTFEKLDPWYDDTYLFNYMGKGPLALPEFTGKEQAEIAYMCISLLKECGGTKELKALKRFIDE